MSTFLQLLRIAFWMHPLQRGFTIIGAAIAIGGLSGVFPFAPPGGNLPTTFIGFALLMLLPLCTGGALFRMLASRRAVMILPHAKGRLLGGMIGITVLATALWILLYFLLLLPAPPKYKPGTDAYVMMYVLTFAFATQCNIGVFIASRGPVWALLMILAWQLPAVVLKVLAVDDLPRLLAGPVGLATVPVAWLAFGIWFMRVHHVERSGWVGTADASVQAPANVPVTATATREAAMQYWLFGATTPLRMATQWGLAAVGLIAVQWFVYVILLGGDNLRAVNAMTFGTLSVSALVVGATSLGIAARARSLWLAGGRLRLALHAWCEWQMLRMVLAILLPFLVAAVLLWLLVPQRPALPALQLFLAMLAPGLAAAWFGLMQQHRRSLFDPLAALAIFVGWYYGLARPLFEGTAEVSWGIVGAQLALVVLLREVAQQRWRSADWRRAQR